MKKLGVGTYFSLEVDLAALKFHRVREFPKMHFQDLIPRIIHHTIMRVSSSSVESRILNHFLTWIRYCRTLTLVSFHCFVPFRKKMMPNSSNYRREVRSVNVEQKGFQKRFPEYPCRSVYQAALQYRGWATHSDSEESRVCWNRGLPESCSILQVRENPGHLSRS